MIEEKKETATTNHEQASKYLAKMLTHTCLCHRRETENEFTEEEFEEMYYDHLLTELARM